MASKNKDKAGFMELFIASMANLKEGGGLCGVPYIPFLRHKVNDITHLSEVNM